MMVKKYLPEEVLIRCLIIWSILALILRAILGDSNDVSNSLTSFMLTLPISGAIYYFLSKAMIEEKLQRRIQADSILCKIDAKINSYIESHFANNRIDEATDNINFLDR